MNKWPKYLIRLDDASAYSDQSKWKHLEEILDSNNIKPIVAVIPNNQDKSIQFESKNEFFWHWIKSMEKKDWSIALHGYKHIYHKVERNLNIFPFYPRSEFSGLNLDSQRIKIKKAIDLFLKNKINPKIWIAPGHCFDANTLKALSLETNISIVSDGISLSPYFYNDFFFIPQQLWSFRKKFFGLWTVCLHPDTMSHNEIEKLGKQIENYVKADKIISLRDINLFKKSPSFFDKILSFIFWKKYNIKLLFRSLK